MEAIRIPVQAEIKAPVKDNGLLVPVTKEIIRDLAQREVDLYNNSIEGVNSIRNLITTEGKTVKYKRFYINGSVYDIKPEVYRSVNNRKDIRKLRENNNKLGLAHKNPATDKGASKVGIKVYKKEGRYSSYAEHIYNGTEPLIKPIRIRTIEGAEQVLKTYMGAIQATRKEIVGAEKEGRAKETNKNIVPFPQNGLVVGSSQPANQNQPPNQNHPPTTLTPLVKEEGKGKIESGMSASYYPQSQVDNWRKIVAENTGKGVLNGLVVGNSQPLNQNQKAKSVSKVEPQEGQKNGLLVESSQPLNQIGGLLEALEVNNKLLQLIYQELQQKGNQIHTNELEIIELLQGIVNRSLLAPIGVNGLLVESTQPLNQNQNKPPTQPIAQPTRVDKEKDNREFDFNKREFTEYMVYILTEKERLEEMTRLQTGKKMSGRKIAGLIAEELNTTKNDLLVACNQRGRKNPLDKTEIKAETVRGYFSKYTFANANKTKIALIR